MICIVNLRTIREEEGRDGGRGEGGIVERGREGGRREGGGREGGRES